MEETRKHLTIDNADGIARAVAAYVDERLEEKIKPAALSLFQTSALDSAIPAIIMLDTPPTNVLAYNEAKASTALNAVPVICRSGSAYKLIFMCLLPTANSVQTLYYCPPSDCTLLKPNSGTSYTPAENLVFKAIKNLLHAPYNASTPYFMVTGGVPLPVLNKG